MASTPAGECKSSCVSMAISSACTPAPLLPGHNDIERLWREVHANVTRNHRCRTIEDLLRRVIWYLHREATRLRTSKPTRLKRMPSVPRAAEDKMTCSESWSSI